MSMIPTRAVPKWPLVNFSFDSWTFIFGMLAGILCYEIGEAIMNPKAYKQKWKRTWELIKL